MWDVAKNTGSQIFKESLIDWDLDKLHICSWLEFYDNIRSIPDDSPDAKTMENDYLLDKWIKKYNMKKRSDQAKDKVGKKGSAKKHGSVITFESD